LAMILISFSAWAQISTSRPWGFPHSSQT